MHNRFLRWLEGGKPLRLGAYWGSAGVCLVGQSAQTGTVCVYQPPVSDPDQFPLGTAIRKVQAIYGSVTAGVALAVAIDADDVFVRSLTVPAGLSDKQLAQVAIVEAVANLPVPPEEICLDFMRIGSAPDAQNEIIRLAFCRRERIDVILADAESVSVSVAIVDRDVQAIHDAVIAFMNLPDAQEKTIYPFGMMLTELEPRLVICLDALTFEIYPIRLASGSITEIQGDLRQQISHCWTRCRMSRSEEALQIAVLIVIGSGLPDDPVWLKDVASENARDVYRLSVDASKSLLPGEPVPPDEVFLIASGLTRR